MKDGFLIRRGLVNNFDVLFDDLFNSALYTPMFEGRYNTDIKETDKEYTILMDLPGVKKENIDISYDKEVLTIDVKQEETKEDKKENYIRKERNSNCFKRTFLIPNIDKENIIAQLQEGILTLTLPKKEVEQSKKIDIK